MTEGRTGPRSLDEMQADIDRQALVEIGKRLADLEKNFWDLEKSAKDLQYDAKQILGTSKRLQVIVTKIVSAKQSKRIKKLGKK